MDREYVVVVFVRRGNRYYGLLGWEAWLVGVDVLSWERGGAGGKEEEEEEKKKKKKKEKKKIKIFDFEINSR